MIWMTFYLMAVWIVSLTFAVPMHPFDVTPPFGHTVLQHHYNGPSVFHLIPIVFMEAIETPEQLEAFKKGLNVVIENYDVDLSSFLKLLPNSFIEKVELRTMLDPTLDIKWVLERLDKETYKNDRSKQIVELLQQRTQESRQELDQLKWFEYAGLLRDLDSFENSKRAILLAINNYQRGYDVLLQDLNKHRWLVVRLAWLGLRDGKKELQAFHTALQVEVNALSFVDLLAFRKIDTERN